MKTSQSKLSSVKTDQPTPFPVIADQVSLSALRPSGGFLSRAWDWIQARRFARPDTNRLRVAETVSLGEKRFVAVVQVAGRHFLLAGGPTNIALLAQLDDREPFEEVLKKTMTAPAKRPQKTRQPVKRSANQGTLRVAKPVRKQTQPSATAPTEHYA